MQTSTRCCIYCRFVCVMCQRQQIGQRYTLNVPLPAFSRRSAIRFALSIVVYESLLPHIDMNAPYPYPMPLATASRCSMSSFAVTYFCVCFRPVFFRFDDISCCLLVEGIDSNGRVVIGFCIADMMRICDDVVVIVFFWVERDIVANDIDSIGFVLRYDFLDGTLNAGGDDVNLECLHFVDSGVRVHVLFFPSACCFTFCCFHYICIWRQKLV